MPTLPVKRPRDRAELRAWLGDPTRGGLYLQVADPKWIEDSIIEVHDDPWAPQLGRFWIQVHRKIEPPARAAIVKAEAAAPGHIKRVGCYVHRRIRHDTPERAKAEGRPLRPLSIHAYAAALDCNANDNRAVTFAPGKTPEPWSAAWKKIWPNGLPREVVEAFESVGWVWGGRWKGFCDPMHFEFMGP